MRVIKTTTSLPDDLDGLQKEKLIPSQLESSAFTEMLSDCHDPSDVGMRAKFSYEGDSKNLEQVPHSQSSSLKRDRSMEALNREYRKKNCTQTALQVWGAERAQGPESLDHGIGFQTCDHAPEYIDEEIVTTLNTALNPEEDPNCYELKYEPNYQEPEIAIHGQTTNPIQLANDSEFTTHILEENNSLPQDCFLVGNSYSVTHSSLANETAPNTVKTVTDSTCPSTSNYTYDECNQSSTETISQSTTEVESSTDNNFYLISKPPLTGPDEDNIVSDFSEILPTDKFGALLLDLDNFKLDSLKSSETDTVLAKFEPPTFGNANVYDQDLNSCDESLLPNLDDLINSMPDDFDDFDNVLVDLGPEEIPREFPEVGGLSIPTTVKDFSHDDDEGGFCKVKRSKRLKKKADSGNHKSATQVCKARQKSILTFLLDSLYDERCNPSCIKWTDQDSGQFKIVNGPELAKKWSDGRKRPELSYGHFARAMRHYYKKGYLSRVPKKKLMYQFGENSNWRMHTPTPIDVN